MGELKNRKAASEDRFTGEMIKDGDDRVVDWIWRLCNMAFESSVMPADWRSAVIVHCTRVKKKGWYVEIIEVLALLSVVEKINAGILVDRVCKMIEGLIDDEEGALFHSKEGFRSSP